MFRCCPRIERCWAKFLPFFFSTSQFYALIISFNPPRWLCNRMLLRLQSFMLFLYPVFFCFFFFSLGVLSVILWTLFCSPSLSGGTLCLTTWENNFAVANADIIIVFFFSCRRTITRKAHSLQCPASHLPLFFFG